MVDTRVWSLAFRRDAVRDEPVVGVLWQALNHGDVIVGTGLVRQGLLQGFTAPKARSSLIERVAALSFVSPQRQDPIDAVELRNRGHRFCHPHIASTH